MFSMRMYLPQGKVPEDELKRVAKLALQVLDYRKRPSAVDAFVISVFDK
jgi:hypothetical protein